LGRSLQYQYAANGYDLQTVQRLRSGTWSTLAQYGYDANDYVNSYSGADGQTWNYTYNNGKLAQVTQPTGEVTTMSYGSDGFLSRVQPPNSASWTQYTWQNGMIQTASTASVGPLTFAWDGLHRLTGVTYPDGTSETRAYDRLDLGSYEDRKGRTTQYSHDADRRVQWVKRPDGKQVTFTWCDCGSLGSIQDSMGRVTTWTRDILGRVTAKTYPDGSTVSYTYDTGRGLLQSALDAKGQRKSYAYGLDGALATVQHTGSQIPTADVALTYDPWDGRLTQMTDGIGATQYSYYTEGSQGGGRVKTVAGPYSGEQVAYVYDGSSRLASRSVDGGTESFTYAQDLLTSIQNPLGNFTYQYSASTGQLSNVNMPNGVATTYSYYPALQDGRLSSINNALGSTTLSNFGYNYDAVGNITNWTIQQGSSSQIWDLTSPQSYDSLDQLSAAVLKDAQGDSTNYDWNYDAAGNRTLEQIGPDHTTAVANNLNQITSLDSSMPVTFTGTTSIPALVTVNGASANTITAKYFGTAVRLNDGGNTVTVQAVSASGVSKTAGYYVNTKKMLKYDANGNMITDGVWDYAWDSEDRLVGIKPANALVPGTALKTWEFGYDGFGRRVRMVTRQGVGEAVETHFVWAGSKIVEARDGQNNLLKRYFSQGMQIASGDKAGLYYYTKDHLGSIREVLDSTGAVRAQYSYDLWGRQTKLAGDVEADFGYAGYYELAGTRLKLTWFRGYNADLGRWLSRDPIGLLGGLNDAHFVLGNPVKYFDLWGLDEAGGQTQAQSVVGTLWDEVVSYVSGAIQKWKNSPVAVVTEKTAGGDATGVASTCAAGVEAGGAAIKAAQVITNSQSQQYDQLKQMGIVGENDAGADEVAARQNVINHVTPTPDQN
jgi:RHS repeat-associated protein